MTNTDPAMTVVQGYQTRTGKQPLRRHGRKTWKMEKKAENTASGTRVSLGGLVADQNHRGRLQKRKTEQQERPNEAQREGA